MSQTPLNAEILAYRTCAACYKPESKKHKFGRCGACQKAAYCSVECQKKDWQSHKKTCQLQAQNRESIPARGTPQRDMLSDIKKWFSKHTQLLVYVGMHAMQLHDPTKVPQTKTHILVLQLEPAPSGKHAEFVFKSVAVRRMTDQGLDSATCAALADRADKAAKDRRYSLTMYVQSGVAVYLAPITVEWCNPSEHVLRFGPPDGAWEMFLQRAINKTLEAGDAARIQRLQQLA
ncbi:hypothetical protein FB451DRAFT_727029 [Mycena latifolia]|nr:hypothetical protein FB451DRAFT_1188724 [Mycena latifolia]KAJ7487783.1 hypothetical protein FB451DRAFT_727029 [Mycena latifolia]